MEERELLAERALLSPAVNLVPPDCLLALALTMCSG